MRRKLDKIKSLDPCKNNIYYNTDNHCYEIERDGVIFCSIKDGAYVSDLLEVVKDVLSKRAGNDIHLAYSYIVAALHMLETDVCVGAK